MSNPFVGESVLFHPHPGSIPQNFGAPLAGVVVALLPQGMVNLAVFDANGGQSAVRNVQFHHSGELRPAYLYAESLFPHPHPDQLTRPHELAKATSTKKGSR